MNTQRPILTLRKKPVVRTFGTGANPTKPTGNDGPRNAPQPARAKPPKPFFIKAAAQFQAAHPSIPLPPILIHNLQNPDQIKPVELGAHETWKAWAKDHGGTKSAQKALCGVLGCMCRSLAYKRAMAAAGSQRHDIQGNPAEPVSEEHRKHVRLTLKAHYAKKHEGTDP